MILDILQSVRDGDIQSECQKAFHQGYESFYVKTLKDNPFDKSDETIPNHKMITYRNLRACWCAGWQYAAEEFFN